MANLIGKKVYAINSEQRKALHIAAVFVNNFTNHMYKTGSDICAENKVPFAILEPLIKKQLPKLKHYHQLQPRLVLQLEKIKEQ